MSGTTVEAVFRTINWEWLEKGRRGKGAYWNEERAEVIALSSSASVSGSNPRSESTQSFDIVEGLFY